MNSSLGYKTVNNIFKNLFNELKSDFIIGRAFSGDEIFFYVKNNNKKPIDTIYLKCLKYNLNYKYISDIYNSKDILGEFLENLIEKLHLLQNG